MFRRLQSGMAPHGGKSAFKSLRVGDYQTTAQVAQCSSKQSERQCRVLNTGRGMLYG